MKVTIFALCLLIFPFIFPTQTFAANFTVNQAGDAGDGTCDATCTLRDAVDDANAAATNDTISFAAFLSTITLTAQITINNTGTLTINGNGANVLTIDGNTGTNGIFFVNGATVTIQGVTLTGGSGSGAAVFADGGTTILEAVVVRDNTGGSSTGAVVFSGGANHRIANSTFSGNAGFSDCAALFAENVSLTVVNTTFSGNFTNESGLGAGAICVTGNSTATFRNTTISGNGANGTSGGGGGGIYVQDSATVNLGNTIVADNTAAGGGPDLFRTSVAGTFTTAGGNLIGDNSGNPSAPNTNAFPTGNPNANGDKVGTTGSGIDPMLGTLTISNGGTTPTRALLSGSPAIDSGIDALATGAGLTTDQRGAGFLRIRDGNGDSVLRVDIGAFEVQTATPPTAAAVSVGGRVTTAEGDGIANARVTITNSNGETQTALSNSLGYYSFTEISAGDTYIFSVSHKRYTFNQSTQVQTIFEQANEVNFVGRTIKLRRRI